METDDRLHLIVARAARRQRRVAATALAGALAVGALGGWVTWEVSGGGSAANPRQVVAAQGTAPGGDVGRPATGGAIAGAPATGPAIAGRPPAGGADAGTGDGQLSTLTLQWTRTAPGGAILRGLSGRPLVRCLAAGVPGAPDTTGAPGSPDTTGAPGSAGTAATPDRQVEVSTAGMVGTATGPPAPPAGAPVTASLNMLGEREGSPLLVVVADTSPAVAEVEVRFPDGTTDSMHPSGGWVALAGGPGPAAGVGVPQVTLTATSATGQVLQSGPVGADQAFGGCCGALPAPAGPGLPAIACPVGAGKVTGTGTTGTGTAATGTAATGSAGSGTATGSAGSGPGTATPVSGG